MNVSPFRLTQDDLSGLDRKTRDGLQPLLDALNITLAQLVQAANLTAPVGATAGTVVSDASGAASLIVKPTVPQKPSSVSLAQLRLADGGDIADVFSMSWLAIGANVRIVFQGLQPATKYAFVLSIQ
jgi:hypothetical protein